MTSGDRRMLFGDQESAEDDKLLLEVSKLDLSGDESLKLSSSLVEATDMQISTQHTSPTKTPTWVNEPQRTLTPEKEAQVIENSLFNSFISIPHPQKQKCNDTTMEDIRDVLQIKEV